MNWDSGEPNDWANRGDGEADGCGSEGGHDAEDCTSMKENGRWNDLPCDNSSPYVNNVSCERLA
jgi:hypothetical protein